MAKLRLIAEQLRADTENVRTLAVAHIERITSLAFVDIVKKGATRRLSGNPQGMVFDHIATKTDDAMILAISSEIAGIGDVSWPDIIEAGSAAPSAFEDLFDHLGKDAKPAPARPQYTDPSPTFNSVFGEGADSIFSGLYNAYKASEAAKKHAPEAWSFADERSAPSQAQAPAPQPAQPVRVGREDLPFSASGVPDVTYLGTAKTGSRYAFVSLREITANGQVMRPMCPFIAFGDEWVAELEKASTANTEICMVFGEDRSPTNKVQIKKAA